MTSPALPIAHLGHLLVDLPLFFGPVAAIVAWLAFLGWRDRRRSRRI